MGQHHIAGWANPTASWKECQLLGVQVVWVWIGINWNELELTIRGPGIDPIDRKSSLISLFICGKLIGFWPCWLSLNLILIRFNLLETIPNRCVGKGVGYPDYRVGFQHTLQIFWCSKVSFAKLSKIQLTKNIVPTHSFSFNFCFHSKLYCNYFSKTNKISKPWAYP